MRLVDPHKIPGFNLMVSKSLKGVTSNLIADKPEKLSFLHCLISAIILNTVTLKMNWNQIIVIGDWKVGKPL